MNQPDDARTVSRKLTKASGSNFYYAFLFLPKPKREAIYAVYAFCRLSDDLVDEAKAGGDPAAALTRWRKELDGTNKTRCTHYEGQKINSPNDIVLKSDGAIFFTDP